MTSSVHERSVERALVRAELRTRLAGEHHLDPQRQALEHRHARILRRSRQGNKAASRQGAAPSPNSSLIANLRSAI